MPASSTLPLPGLRLTGPALGTALTAFLDSRPERPRLLGLGEPTHLIEAFPLLRNRVLRHLVEEHGYRSVALESSCLAGLAVDAYVTGGDGDLEAVMANGFSHDFGKVAANRELVIWLREHNANLPEADRVRFHGFDLPTENTSAPSPRRPLTALLEILGRDPHSLDSLLGDDDAWATSDAAYDPSRSIGDSPAARELRIRTDDLIAVLETEAPAIENYDRAALFARTAQTLLRYHAVMADPGADRVERMLKVRDSAMAANLLALTAADARRGPTLVFAHNGHLQRTESTGDWGELHVRWWSAGAIAATRLGPEYAVIAVDAGSVPDAGIPAPPAETLQAHFAGNTLHPAEELLESGLPARTDTADNPRYAPLGQAALAGVDAVAFLPKA